MTTPKKISKRLRKERKSKDSQIDQMQEQLTITDAIIDEYDELINKIDEKINPLLDPINSKIDEIKAAYDLRISQNSRSNLYWEKSDAKVTKRLRVRILLPMFVRKILVSTGFLDTMVLSSGGILRTVSMVQT